MLVGFAVTMIACAQAHRHFKSGKMHYWPKAGRQNIPALDTNLPRPLETS